MITDEKSEHLEIIRPIWNGRKPDRLSNCECQEGPTVIFHVVTL